jgi:hypothetical protein
MRAAVLKEFGGVAVLILDEVMVTGSRYATRAEIARTLDLVAQRRAEAADRGPLRPRRRRRGLRGHAAQRGLRPRRRRNHVAVIDQPVGVRR